MIKNNYRSKCCNAEVKIDGIPDFLGSKDVCTIYYVCLKCNKPCDVLAPIGGDFICGKLSGKPKV